VPDRPHSPRLVRVHLITCARLGPTGESVSASMTVDLPRAPLAGGAVIVRGVSFPARQVLHDADGRSCFVLDLANVVLVSERAEAAAGGPQPGRCSFNRWKTKMMELGFNTSAAELRHMHVIGMPFA
jgi:hypothetical protein